MKNNSEHFILMSIETKKGQKKNLIFARKRLTERNIKYLYEKFESPLALFPLEYKKEDRVALTRSCQEYGVELLLSKEALSSWLVDDSSMKASSPQNKKKTNIPKFKDLFAEFCQVLTWDNNAGEKQLTEMEKLVNQHYPSQSFLLQEARKVAKNLYVEVQRIKMILHQRGSHSSHFLRAKKDFQEKEWSWEKTVNRYLTSAFLFKIEKEEKWLEKKKKQIQINKLQGKPPAIKHGKYPHRIDQLKPQKRWTLLIDETGDRFNRPKDSSGRQGRFVGLLLPEKHGLPELSNFHATHASAHQLVNKLQMILDSPVGIMGITVDEVPETKADTWQVGVLELIEWVLRLLPASDKGISLDVFVEERGGIKRGEDWESAVADLLRGLENYRPDLKDLLKMNIKVIGKKEHPYLAYADLLAYIWGSPAKENKKRFEEMGLSEICFLHNKTQLLKRAWEQTEKRIPLRKNDWNTLLLLAEKTPPESLPRLLLEKMSQLLIYPNYREVYLNYIEEHLNSKKVSLPYLGLQLEWLSSNFLDLEDELLPKKRLSWKSAYLALKNHKGYPVDPKLDEEIVTLGKELYEEDASLVCLADLRRAVTYTNEFHFEKAKEIIEFWLKQPVAVAGLQFYARAKSSMGQYHAFKGDLATARSFFEEALEHFERLSDPDEREGEKKQTQTYLALSIIDDEQLSSEEVRTLLEKHLGWKDRITLAQKFGRTFSLESRYLHHTFVRYLFAHGTEEEKSHYLASLPPNPSLTEDSHPWPLIYLYRAFFFKESGELEKAATALRHAIELLQENTEQEGFAVLYFMLAVIFGILRRWQELSEENIVEYNDFLDSINKSLPQLSERIEKLRDPHSFSSDRELLTEMLPFNFR